MQCLSRLNGLRLLIGLLVLFGLAACSEKPLTAKQILDQAYPVYDQKHTCWIYEGGEYGRYCMTLDSEQKLTLKEGERLYVMAVGNLVDEHGEPNEGHVFIGAVGAFVAETRNGKSAVIAANPNIQAGASGFGPTGWKLVKLGAADYWGWQNTWGDCHQGYCGSHYSILAPYGKSVKEIGSMTADYDNMGACGGTEDKLDENGNTVLDEKGEPVQVEIDCEKTATAMETTLKIDTQNAQAKVYPLLITVTGQDAGVALTPKAWRFTFDSKKWQYQQPSNYPLADADF